MNKQVIIPQKDDIGKRVDKFLCEQLKDWTRSAVQHLLENGNFTVGEIIVKKNYKISGDEIFELCLPEVREVNLVPQNLPLDIVYEDEDIIVINKVRGMVVHPAAGNWDGTLVNALMYHCGQRLSGINGELRPGIVHRIDKDTSGLLVVAKNDFAHQSLAAQIQTHSIRREYEAIVSGCLRKDSGTINKPIGRSKQDRKKMAIISDGREAITHYQIMGRYRRYTHIAFQLETGRTHQIRVHMASIGHPIIGDPLYGPIKDRFANIGGQCLHAIRLTLTHPRSRKKMIFEVPKPKYFSEILEKLATEL